MTSHVNLETKKIYNAEPNSWKYFHELGHIAYSNTEIAGRLGVYQGLTLYIWIFSTTLGIINKYMFGISLLTAIVYIGIDVYEEYWCNRYANKHYKGV